MIFLNDINASLSEPETSPSSLALEDECGAFCVPLEDVAVLELETTLTAEEEVSPLPPLPLSLLNVMVIFLWSLSSSLGRGGLAAEVDEAWGVAVAVVVVV